MKQMTEAAQLYEKAESWEKAATTYLALKMFKQASPLIDKINTPKLLIQLANAK